MDAEGNDVRKFVLVFLGGAVLGACAGLLCAPRAGRETREKLRTLVNEARAKITRAREDEGHTTRAA